MPIIHSTETITLTAGGGTVNLDVLGQSTLYLIEGTATLTSNWTIQPTGTVNQYLEYRFKYQANIDLDGNTITIFGETLPTHLSDKSHEITATWNGSGWDVDFIPDISEDDVLLSSNIAGEGWKVLPTSSEVMENGDDSPIVVNSVQTEGTTQSKLYYKCDPYSKTVQIAGVVDVVSIDETAVSGSLSVSVIQFTTPDNVTSALGLYLNIPLVVEYQTSGTTANQSGALSPTFKAGYLQKAGTFAAVNFVVPSANLGSSTTARYSAYINITVPYTS